MPDFPRVTLGDLAHRALATRDAAERQALVAQLARGTRTPEQATAYVAALKTAKRYARDVY